MILTLKPLWPRRSRLDGSNQHAGGILNRTEEILAYRYRYGQARPIVRSGGLGFAVKVFGLGRLNNVNKTQPVVCRGDERLTNGAAEASSSSAGVRVMCVQASSPVWNCSRAAAAS